MTKSLPRLLPGDFAVWLFIFMELLVFAMAFISYAIARLGNVELFDKYQKTLNTEFGVINTLVLITSSYFVVRSVHAIRVNNIRSCVFWLYAAIAGGLVFITLKSIEYYDKFSEGIGLSTNIFYMFYLSLTLFHYFHIVLGVLVLLFIAIKAQRGEYSATNHIGLESGASYWHMVDLVWLVLFPLVYIL